jgi:peptidoglycan/xylan/chitin deacetylase (PgdA/CDA1 family)
MLSSSLIIILSLSIPVLVILAMAFAYLRYTHEVPVLMYHRVADVPHNRLAVPPAMFTAQMAYLREHGFHSVSLDELFAYYRERQPLPSRPIVITFDDGFVDNYTTALPILQQYDLSASVCIISGWVDRENDWEEYRGKTAARTMNWEQIHAWRDAGMGIVCHTVNHPRLNKLRDEDIVREITVSKRTLEEQLGQAIDFLCYPYGDFDTRVQRLTQQAGFKGALAIFERAPLWRFAPYAIRRIAISSRQPLTEFAGKVSPWHFVFLLLRKLERGLKPRK